MTRVFVYGTLMRGFRNHALLEGSIFEKVSATMPAFTMIDLSGFPGIVRGGNVAIMGETYRVGHATLASIDRLEGHPNFYRREKLSLIDGTEAEAYILPGDHLGDRLRAQIRSGSWRAHVALTSCSGCGASIRNNRDFCDACERNEQGEHR